MEESSLIGPNRALEVEAKSTGTTSGSVAGVEEPALLLIPTFNACRNLITADMTYMNECLS